MVFPHWMVVSRSFYTIFPVDGEYDFAKLAMEWGETIHVYKTRTPVASGTYKAKVNYKEYIRSKSWQKIAMEAKRRVKYRCQLCNRHQSELPLHAHHRTYENLGRELPEDITVLCEECHKTHHDNDRKNGSGV
jgi:5-methylcytosine-specific restriction endonuclease McrA